MFPTSIKSHHVLDNSLNQSFKETINRPKITKVILHRSLGLKAQDNKLLQQSLKEMRLITGQQPTITRAKKSIATFKTREGMPIGLKVTIRGTKMYAFVDRLIHLVLPQIKDFRGLKSTQFDDEGNYHLGVVDQSVFPELQTDFNDAMLGFDISLVTNLKNKKQAQDFLSQLGFPFR